MQWEILNIKKHLLNLMLSKIHQRERRETSSTTIPIGNIFVFSFETRKFVLLWEKISWDRKFLRKHLK